MYIPKGVEECSKILGYNHNYVVYYDPDVDGVIAGSMVERLLNKYNFKSKYYINEDRGHGFKMSDNDIKRLNGYTLIAVDFSMTKEEVSKLLASGVNVVNIDHHDIKEDKLVYLKDDKTKCQGVIINNQYSFEPEEWRFLSGAGMVYHVFKALTPNALTLDDVALVGISLLSDIRVIENKYAKYYLKTLYHHKSPLLDYLLNVTKPLHDFGFGEMVLDRNYIDYTLSPKINSLFRLNKGDEAVAIFKGQYPLDNYLEVFRRMQKQYTDLVIDKSEGTNEELRKKGIVLDNLVFRYFSDENGFNNYNPANFVGVACSQVKNAGKTTLIYYGTKDKIQRGSVRGLLDSVDYLQIFSNYGFNCKGHHNAFGILETDLSNIDLEELDKVIGEEEAKNIKKEYENRILEISNLNFFVKSKNADIADYNNYVRDSKRVLIKYTGNNIKRFQKGKMVEYVLDGVAVKCFDENLSIDNGVILAIKERGYIQFYLKSLIGKVDNKVRN